MSDDITRAREKRQRRAWEEMLSRCAVANARLGLHAEDFPPPGKAPRVRVVPLDLPTTCGVIDSGDPRS